MPDDAAILVVEGSQRTLRLGEAALPSQHGDLAASSSSRDVAAAIAARPRARSSSRIVRASWASIWPPSLASVPVSARRMRAGCPDGTTAVRPSTSAHARPPCASATPRATNRPILLPAPVPGRRAANSASASAVVSSVPSRHTVSCNRSPTRPPSIVIGPSRPHHACASMNDRSALFTRAGSATTTSPFPAHRTSGCSGSRFTDSTTPSASSASSIRSGNISSVPDATASGVDQQPQDRVHAVGVVDDPLQHQGALLLRHDLPSLLQRVAEPLHRRQRRTDVVGGRGHDRLERDGAAAAPAGPTRTGTRWRRPRG